MTKKETIDNLKHGVDVYTSDGEKVGKLHAVVLDPQDNRLTHIAVNAGPGFPAPGFGDPEIVSVDMDQLADATEERVDLTITRARFDELPLYEFSHFFNVPDATPPDTSGLGRLWNAGLAIAASLASLGTGLAVPAEHFRKASFERHILNDAPVWRIEPNTHIGYVERVLVNETTDEIVALVIRRGVLFKEDVVLPMQYVKEISDGVIHAQISDDEAEALETYEPE